MQDTQCQISDSLSAVLREVEVAHIVNDDDAVDLSHNRRAVVKAAIHYKVSRYRFGETLALYKSVIPYAAWMPAVQGIADSIGVNERTIRNILADYERTVPLAPQVIEAMESAGIDPAAKKNGKVVSILRYLDVDDPIEAVAAAVTQAAATKAKCQIPGTVQPTPDEREVYKVRLAIRSALSNVPPNQKLNILEAAIAQEVYASMGITSILTITPCVPTLDLMGLKRTETVATDREVSA